MPEQRTLSVNLVNQHNEVVASWTIEDGIAVLGADTPEHLREALCRINVVDPGNPPTLVTPADGERYLRALPYTFRPPYLWADVIEEWLLWDFGDMPSKGSCRRPSS
jgi:hypothetical protein